MFSKDVASVFTKMGLRQNEIDVYTCLLRHRAGLHVQEITDTTGIKRSTVNLVLDRLIHKGFVAFHVEEARKVFTAEDPAKIQLNLDELATNFKGLIPILTATQLGDKPSRVRFFEGKDTVNKIHRDIILSTKFLDGKKELLAFSSGQDLYEAESEEVERFVKDRIKNALHLKWIAPNNAFTRKRFVTTAKEELRDVKFFDPQKYRFRMQINIYANSVALINLKGQENGVIIENELIADSFRALFNLLWDRLN